MADIENVLYDFLSRFQKEKTKIDYKRDLYNFYKYIDKNFLEVSYDDCKIYMNFLKHKIEKKEIAVSTGEKLYSQLYSFFNYLEQHSYIQYNHFKKITKPKASRLISKDRIISWKELDQLISVLKTYNIRDYSILMLIFTSGLTLQDAVDLKWNQFVVDNQDNIGIQFETTKGIRYVKVHKDIWDLIQEYKEKSNEIHLLEHYVFLNNRGQKISGRWMRTVISKACNEAGLEKSYTPRELRHTLAAYALKKGATAEQVKEQLGWSQSSLAERYLYTIQELNDNAIDYLNFSLKKE